MILLKTKEEIAFMREGGKKLSKVLADLTPLVKPGVSTEELDRAATALILQQGAQVAFKGYEDFPGSLCVAVNDEIVHAVPSERLLKEGDIITLDIGLIWKGFYLDMARTVPVGAVDPETTRLIQVTKKALRLGIKKVRPGNTIGDIGNTIQRFVESQEFHIVEELCGHGIGRKLHEEPLVLNYGNRHTGTELREGMVICIEPMVAVGTPHIKRSRDGYGFSTADGSLSAHFEDTIAITSRGCEVLTQ